MSGLPHKFAWMIALGLPLPGKKRPERWEHLPECPLPPTARHVARVLAEHMNADGDDCWPSLELIARETGYSLSTVNEALRAIEGAGYLERRRGGGRNKTTIYVPTIPETVRLSDGFRGETVRRSPRNSPGADTKQSGSRTRGFKEASIEAVSPGLSPDEVRKLVAKDLGGSA